MKKPAFSTVLSLLLAAVFILFAACPLSFCGSKTARRSAFC